MRVNRLWVPDAERARLLKHPSRTYGRTTLIAATLLATIWILHLLDPYYQSKQSRTNHEILGIDLVEPEQEPHGRLTHRPAEQLHCSVTKVSMLYGDHQSTQMGQALESHRRHSERWGCGFELLEEELTERTLYSKHYFLLSMLLRELAKPKKQRKEWLLYVSHYEAYTWH